MVKLYNESEDESDTFIENVTDEIPEDFLSKPILSKVCSIPENILQFKYSFGYDCKRLFNLCLIDPNVLVFASGNLINFFTISTKQLKTRRSACGGGIGYITKNPNPEYNYLTIAENGVNPPILIYKYPEMEVISICKGGTERCFSYVDYSHDGESMVSQGGHPDYMITVWNWQSSSIILRAQSFQNTVFKVMYSIYDSGLLATSGLAHLKFWKICQTFTGLKLIGEYGRFGKTEICDIVGTCILPGGQVLSGCDWGNILVWEEGLIKVEVCRKNRLSCHKNAITQIYYNDGEVMTVAKDGYVRIWFWETVDLADPPDDDLFVEIEPIYEYFVGTKEHTSCLMSMEKRDLTSWWWYAQDGNGGVWAVDISPENTPEPSQMLFRCHSGPVIGVGVCPFGTFLATLGEDGRLHVYNYRTNELLFFKQFIGSGRCLMWLPLSMDSTGVVLILGFGNGVVRIVALSLNTDVGDRVNLLQVWKPHCLAITKMSINDRETVLVTGSEDNTIFLHQVSKQKPFVFFYPIGFVDVPSAATAFTWKPNLFATLLVGCLHGEILEFDVPERPRSYIDQTYQLTHLIPKQHKFKSVKSEILRKVKLKQLDKLKAIKKVKKMSSLQKLKEANPDIKIDEDAFLADSDSEEELEPIFIPPVPNQILWLKYTDNNTFLLSMGGYDAGYLYEYSFINGAINSILVKGGNDLEINCYLNFEDLIIFGMSNGAVRVNAIRKDIPDFSNYYLLNMHDNYNGIIHDMAISADKRFLFTVGNDGNIFSFQINYDVEPIAIDYAESIDEQIDEIADIEDPNYLSLEQEKQQNNQDIRARIANAHKSKVLKILEQYKVQFEQIMDRNKKLKLTQQVSQAEVELDPRITWDFQQDLDGQMQIVQRKLAFDLEKNRLLSEKMKEFFIEPLDHLQVELFEIKSNRSIKTFRMKKLNDEFIYLKELVQRMIREEADRKRIVHIVEEEEVKEQESSIKRIESFLEDLSGSTVEHKLGLQMYRLLRQYRLRKSRESDYEEIWEQINAVVPDPNANDPNDVILLQEAELSIGDYKLRTDPTFFPGNDEVFSASNKFEELLQIREEATEARSIYNNKIFYQRDKKKILVDFVQEQLDVLKQIHEELPEDEILFPKIVPKINEFKEYPNSIMNAETKPVKHVEPIVKRSLFKFIIKNEHYKLYAFKQNTTQETSTLDWKDEDNKNYTEWEKELCNIRLAEKLFEQEQIIADINERIDQFDSEIEEIEDTRLYTDIKAKYLEIHLLTLYQELWILKDFKHIEDTLEENMNEDITAKNELKLEMMLKRDAIEQHKRNIENYNEQIKLNLIQFQTDCMNNKFSDFFRKIFKKKSRPIKDNYNPDVESESSMSDDSSSEEDNDADESKDSADIGIIHMDETICPTGCSRELYNLTFSLRAQRHQMEQKLRDESNCIDNCNSRIEIINKTIKTVEAKIDLKHDELMQYLRKKLVMLNDIQTLVVLKMNQIQHFHNQQDMYAIKDTLLFNNGEISKLYSRVAQIGQETIEAQRKHRINVIHLARMKTDCAFMEKRIHDLDLKYEETMLKKFGMIVDINDLEEGILRKMVYNLKGNISHIQNHYIQKANHMKQVLAEKQTALKQVTQEEIEKLNILTVLKEEENFLKSLLIYQKKAQLRTIATSQHTALFERDLSKLQNISIQQKLKIESLEKEIRTLRLKAKPFGPITTQTLQISKQLPNQQLFDIFYEDSVYTSDTRTSTRNNRHNPTVYLTTITKLVDQFMLTHLHGKMAQNELKALSNKISEYFAKVAENFNYDESEEIINCVVENFNSMMPRSWIQCIPPKDVGIFFHTILETCNALADQQLDYQPAELLASIVSNVRDSLDTTKHRNFTQHLFCELIKSLVVTLSIDDFSSAESVEVLSSNLSQIDGLLPRCVNEEELITSVMEYAVNNFVDDLTVDRLRQFVHAILEALSNKINIDLTM